MNPETIAILTPAILALTQIVKAIAARSAHLPTLHDLAALVAVFVTGLAVALGADAVTPVDASPVDGLAGSLAAIAFYTIGRVIKRSRKGDSE